MPAADAVIDEDARTRRAYAALIGTQVCFGLFPVFGKLAFDAFEPPAVASWRIGFGALVLGALAFLREGGRALPSRGDWWRLAVCSWLGVAGNQFLFLEGLERTSAVNAGLVICLIPVFTYAIAAAARHERFRPRRAAGIAVALVGSSLLFAARNPDAKLARENAVGIGLMVGNGLLYSGFLVLARPLFARMSPLALIAWAYLLSTPALIWLAPEAALVPAAASAQAWLSLGYVLLFATVAAYLLNAIALERLSASTTAMFIYVQPVVTGVAALALLGERPGMLAAAAAVLLFAGLWLVLRRG